MYVYYPRIMIAVGEMKYVINELILCCMCKCRQLMSGNTNKRMEYFKQKCSFVGHINVM